MAAARTTAATALKNFRDKRDAYKKEVAALDALKRADPVNEAAVSAQQKKVDDAKIDMDRAEEELNDAKTAVGTADDALRAAGILAAADRLGHKATVEEITRLVSEDVAENLPSQYVFFHGGLISLNPYDINRMNDAFVLESSDDSDLKLFLEVVFRHRTAWLDPEDWVFADRTLRLCDVLGGIPGLSDGDRTTTNIVDRLLPQFDLVPKDYEIRIGLSGIGGSEGDATGSTVAGAGDAYLEGSAGWRIWTAGMYDKNNQPYQGEDRPSLRSSFNFEILGGISTDRELNDVHDYLALGVATVWGIDPTDYNRAQDRRRIELVAGVYWGEVEVPVFLSPNLVPEELEGQRVIASNNGSVDFDDESGTMIRGDVHFPMGDNGYFT
ncbi:MAG: hypothetical protein AAF492_29145, partial [Verrucomicrobiota bacterium]